jgi:hypothetical protein
VKGWGGPNFLAPPEEVPGSFWASGSAEARGVNESAAERARKVRRVSIKILRYCGALCDVDLQTHQSEITQQRLKRSAGRLYRKGLADKKTAKPKTNEDKNANQ